MVLGRARRTTRRLRALAAHGNRTLVRVRQPPKALGAPDGCEGGLERRGAEGGELQQQARLLRERGAAPRESEQRLEGAGAPTQITATSTAARP